MHMFGAGGVAQRWPHAGHRGPACSGTEYDCHVSALKAHGGDHVRVDAYNTSGPNTFFNTVYINILI